MTVRERGNMWSYRSLIWNFAQRDLKALFKGTAPRAGRTDFTGATWPQ
jgi:hypothetical protein